jgi:hypothetical protein
MVSDQEPLSRTESAGEHSNGVPVSSVESGVCGHDKWSCGHKDGAGGKWCVLLGSHMGLSRLLFTILLDEALSTVLYLSMWTSAIGASRYVFK